MSIPGKQWRSAAVILSGILPILFASSAGALKPAPAVVKRILVFGDSLSDGLSLPRSQVYPALLAGKLRAAGLNYYEVGNASASGDTSSGGLQRLPPHLERRIDIFILQLGVNDAFRHVAVDQIRANLQAIIDKVKTRNPDVRIVIAGMQVPNPTDDYVQAFGQMYVDLTASNEAALVPYLLAGVAGIPALNMADRIHPNAAGQKILAENVWRALEPVARETAAATSAHVK